MRFDLDMPAWKWPFYVMRHPFEGYEDLRWKKAYSMRVAMTIVVLFFIVAVCDQLFTGFLFNRNFVKVFNIVPIIVSSIIMFFTWVIGNWSLCTLFNGEGSMKNICVNTAYALVPYLMASTISIILSNVLLISESAFITFVMYIGIGWTVILLISGMKTVHQYSLIMTIVSMLATLFAMVIIIFLLVLLLTLFQQVYVFVYSIYTELLYRFSTLEPITLILISLGILVLFIAAIIGINVVVQKVKAAMKTKKLAKLSD